MNNKEIAEIVFNKIKSFGFKPYDIKYGDGYFIFDMGENSVVHFHIKGCRHWKFGMWINSEFLDEKYLKEYCEKNNCKESDLPIVQIFAQYETCIDKFKPSRSYHCVDCFTIDDYMCFELEYMIKHIKKHPFIAYAEDKHFSRFYIWYFIKSEFYDKKIKLKNYMSEKYTYIYNWIKVQFIKRSKIVDKIELIDGNTEDWVTYPRYSLNITFNSDSTKEECKLLNFWFHKDYYKNLNLNLYNDNFNDGKSYVYERSENEPESKNENH